MSHSRALTRLRTLSFIPIGAFILVAAPRRSAGQASCVSDIRNAGPNGSFCQGSDGPPASGSTPAGAQQVGNALGSLVGSVIGAGLVKPLPPMPAAPNISKNAEDLDQPDPNVHKNVGAAQDIINDFNKKGSAPGCDGDGVCLDGDTPSMAVLGEEETPRWTDAVADLPSDCGSGNCVVVNDGPAPIQNYLAEYAETNEKGALATEALATTVSGIKVVFPVSMAEDIPEGFEAASDGAALISIESKYANGDTAGAGGEIARLALGHLVIDPALQAAGTEPHLFVRQVLMGSERLSETNIMGGLQQLRSEMGIPAYFSESEKDE
jgi:hypothetical protein